MASRRNTRSRTAAALPALRPHTYDPDSHAYRPWVFFPTKKGLWWQLIIQACHHPVGSQKRLCCSVPTCLPLSLVGVKLRANISLMICQISANNLSMRRGEKPPSAAEASLWVSEFLALHPDGDKHWSLGILIAGFDKDSGPSLYKVDGKGKLVEGSLLGIGSASVFAPIHIMMRRQNYLYKSRYKAELTMDEAKELAKRAICLGVYCALERAPFVSVFHIGSAGVTPVVTNADIVEFQKEHFGTTWRDPNPMIFWQRWRDLNTVV